MKKLFIILILTLMVLTACAKDNILEPVTEQTEQLSKPTEVEITETPIPVQKEQPIENKPDEETKESTNNETTEEVRIDTGKFSGMIDANFFEVQISGVPESIAARVFMLTDESREKFDELELEPDDELKIHYYVNDQEQMVVVDIEKMN